jgi:hypothetical protein
MNRLKGNKVLKSKYSCDAVFTDNTFQELPWLRETADNTDRYIYRDIRVTNINTVKFNDKKGLSEHKHCDDTAANVNSENARSRMEASSSGEREYGGKGR